MISWKRRVMVANDTLRFQATDRNPSLENCEAHDKYLAHLEKHKAEINEARERRIAKAIAICEEKAAAGKGLNLKELKEVNRALGYSIGRSDASKLVRAFGQVAGNEPVIHGGWLVAKEYGRERSRSRALLFGIEAEAKKQAAYNAKQKEVAE